jgi:hypothetical protein
VHNVLVPGVGHIALPVHGRVVHTLALTLSHLDPDGTEAA